MTTLSGEASINFDSYWQDTLDELTALPPAPEVQAIPLRSTDFATAYGVSLTSIGPYRLYAYLSIPRGEGPFPARYYLPRYGSVTDLVPQGTSNSQRREHVTFAICVRGQRLADQPYAAAFPGLLTDGIDDPMGYVYRGIVADCVRGVEYLASRPEVDGARIAAIGNDLAYTTAALCAQVTHLVCTPALLYDTANLARRTSAYPLEEITDYLRLHPEREDAVRHTLSHFDLRRFASRVNATTLLMAGADGSALDAAALAPLIQAMPGEVEVHKAEHSGYKDGRHSEEWLSRRFGMAEASLPAHWRG
ncbi:MAG: acetylxylan esterase [Chloroflexota bacterium]|nr:acetylxylan esterase [Chloroflexota bacterium]MDE2684408.1 acetylxylan esterase [Chloroflexota bacterium]